MVDIILDSNIVTITSKLISIALGLVGLFLLFEIKSRVVGEAKKTFIYFILAAIWMIIVRTLGIMDELGIWVSTFYDSAIVIFSLFFLLGIISFYNYIMGMSKQVERNISEPEKAIEPKTTIVYSNKLSEMEKKINDIENRIKEGNVKSGEAVQMSNKFKMQLASLSEAYEKGYISKGAYERGKERIKEVNQVLKKKHL